MDGLMMNMPLMISSLLRHADRHHGDTEIVSRSVEGPIHRYTYRDAHARARRLARALARLGVRDGERVGTLAWNGYRHFELYYAVSGMGAIIHTINPRLFFDQLAYTSSSRAKASPPRPACRPCGSGSSITCSATRCASPRSRSRRSAAPPVRPS